jgi:hypothetical protein
VPPATLEVLMIRQFLSIEGFGILIYLLGGLIVFAGIPLITLMHGINLFGWGDGRTIGYLALCVGLCFVFGSILMVRLARNRCA